MTDPKPTGRPIATQKRGKTTYKLYANGELWTGGRHGFLCGYVADPDGLDYAIDMHEEELHFLMAEFQ